MRDRARGLGRVAAASKDGPPRRVGRPGGSCGSGERRGRPAGRWAELGSPWARTAAGRSWPGGSRAVSPRCLWAPYPATPWEEAPEAWPVPAQGALSVRGRNEGWCPSVPLGVRLRVCPAAPGHRLVLEDACFWKRRSGLSGAAFWVFLRVRTAWRLGACAGLRAPAEPVAWGWP